MSATYNEDQHTWHYKDRISNIKMHDMDKIDNKPNKDDEDALHNRVCKSLNITMRQLRRYIKHDKVMIEVLHEGYKMTIYDDNLMWLVRRNIPRRLHK